MHDVVFNQFKELQDSVEHLARVISRTIQKHDWLLNGVATEMGITYSVHGYSTYVYAADRK